MPAFAFAVCVLSGSAHAQTTEDSVKAAVNLLFVSMKDSDPAGIRRSFTDSAILQSIAADKQGKTVATSETVEAFATVIAKIAKGDADERIRIDVVKIDGDLAIVWAPYSFYYKGQRNHCGVDSFQMLRVGGVWKIQYIIDTRRKEGCIL